MDCLCGGLNTDHLYTGETWSFLENVSHLCREVELNNSHSLDCILLMPLPMRIRSLWLQTKTAKVGYSQYFLKNHLVLTSFQEVASILCVHSHSSVSTETVQKWNWQQLYIICCPFKFLEITESTDWGDQLCFAGGQDVTHAEQLLHNRPTL